MKLLKPGEKNIANTRATWKNLFVDIGEWDPDAVVLVGDVSRSTMTDIFKERYPDRFFNTGIAEQNMIGMAAGLALSGKHPYCIAFAPFLSMRACEQFRTDVCYMDLNVTMISVYGGVSASGSTHSGLEDCGIIRGMGNSAVIAPSEANMVHKAFRLAAGYQRPLYIRLDSGLNTPVLYDEDYELQLGKALLAKEGSDVTICSFGGGGVLEDALDAALRLERDGVSVRLLDMVSLKPLDREAVLAAARETGRIVTVEDHNVNNGVGSAVAEVIAEAGVPCRLKRLGVQDVYPCYGPLKQIHHKYGYGADDIEAALREILR